MFHMVPGGTMGMSATPGQGPAATAQLQATMERLNQLMERLLERTQTSSDRR